MSTCTLDKVKMNTTVMVDSIKGDRIIRRRMMELGILSDCELFVRKTAPLGDPIEITVLNTELTLRKIDAINIIVKPIAKN